MQQVYSICKEVFLSGLARDTIVRDIVDAATLDQRLHTCNMQTLQLLILGMRKPKLYVLPKFLDIFCFAKMFNSGSTAIMNDTGVEFGNVSVHMQGVPEKESIKTFILTCSLL